MFNKQQPPTPPGEDRAGAPMLPAPELPALRTFVVERYSNKTNEVGSVTVMAHEAGLNANGNILRFLEYFVHPTDGPSQRVVRCFNGWNEYEEKVTEAPSRIIVPSLTFAGLQ